MKMVFSWKDTVLSYVKPAAVRMFFLGFSSGLPLLLVLGTLSFWLREAGVDLKTIGIMSWVGLVYGLKWLWAPLIDRVPILGLTKCLGRRRAWLLLSQLGIIFGLFFLGSTEPTTQLSTVAVLALFTAFCSASQDITLDAYRMETAEVEQQAVLAANYQTGYRLAMIWAGAGALALATWSTTTEGYSQEAWRFAYWVMAASMSVGVITVLMIPEPPSSSLLMQWSAQQQAMYERLSSKYLKWPKCLLKAFCWFYEAAVLPFLDFFIRFRAFALVILLLIATYRISDVVMGVMANPFYLDLGYTKAEVAAVSKVFGVAMSLLGAFIGGFISLRIGIMRTLFLGAILAPATNLLFSWLATQPHDIYNLIFTISADNLAGGIASVAFVAYLSGLTSKAYTATQYALFSSVMLILPKFLAGFSGFVVDAVGYANFFTLTALLGLPVIFLVFMIVKGSQISNRD